MLAAIKTASQRPPPVRLPSAPVPWLAWWWPLPTGDGELIIVAGNHSQFRKLAGALGAPELADDERFASVASRNANRCARCWSAGWRLNRRLNGSPSCPPPASRAARSTTSARASS